MRLLTVFSALAMATLHGLVGAQETTKPATKPPAAAAAAADTHTADRAAIAATMKSFAHDFETRDAKALAAHWTAEGEFHNDAGLVLQGRAAIETAFAQFFAKTPEVTSSAQSDALRFLSADAAIDEGVVTVRRGPVEPARQARYTALFVRDAGDWRLAQLSESTIEGVSIEDLAWLVGEWQSVLGEGAEVHTTYAWDANRKFLHSTFQVQRGDRTLTGTQVIGVDPATGLIHTWTFEADGGVGESDWNRDGDHWVIDATGTLTDGSTLAETNIVRRVNDDTFTWQSVDRTLDEAQLPDQAPIKVMRVAPAK